MKQFDRIFVIVLDLLGIGGMEDAAEYGDAGADRDNYCFERFWTRQIRCLWPCPGGE